MTFTVNPAMDYPDRLAEVIKNIKRNGKYNIISIHPFSAGKTVYCTLTLAYKRPPNKSQGKTKKQVDTKPQS